MTKPGRDLALQRKASADLSRPGLRCSAPRGTWTPVVDMARCEAEDACVAVCPNEVFDVRRIDNADYRSLSRTNRVRVLVHGKKMAYVTADRCKACGMCVVSCPKDAISLEAPTF